ncbi:HAD-IC family P-type ATPase [Cyanobium sp. ATX 6E8]|uniref:cation-translocating P-type ATPase n=1 Tax=Cyanobium sp. ATX 6E8 TaxID=2823701 RepID=UPI0020CDF662|nr:HAD-IC family P-type ATPase [Cyanobium sp. ATX 6E8]MCP9943148.1 HAD-IC family P-type ATPase [Cyanobium sp. ATX 6E8]
MLDASPHAQTAAAVLQQLGSDPAEGLAAAEVARRCERYGRNELAEPPTQPGWLKLLLQFHQPLLYILLVAGLIKALLGSWTNALVIWAVTLINAVIGYIQEARAEGAIAALARSVSTETTVLRDGQTLRIPSRDLVPGDVVQLAAGDKVPADLRLVEVRDLQVDESGLTGESLPVLKDLAPLLSDTPLADRRCMVHAGSFVTSGQGFGVVVATGDATEMGAISQSLQQRSSLSTPLTRRFARFSRVLLYFILAVAALTLAIGLGRGQPFAEVFEAAVALAVSAIPEGLPAVVTITLAIGVNRMAARHAIIRKLPAVEALGSATVICSDKTGTLTENQMTVQVVEAGGVSYRVTGGGYSPHGDLLDASGAVVDPLPDPLDQLLRCGVLCNDARLMQEHGNWSCQGDPTEGALLAAAEKAGLTRAGLEGHWPRLDVLPFASDHQYMATLHDGDDSERLLQVKGSLEALLPRCAGMLAADGAVVPVTVAAIQERVDALAGKGLRLIAFAAKRLPHHRHDLSHEDVESGLVFLGLQGMLDPPRPEAIAAVAACQRAGISVRMITGDHAATAAAIAARMGLGGSEPASQASEAEPLRAYTGRDLAAMDSAQLAAAAAAGQVFARVAPAQKLELVKALQAQGEVVAMTGDGVNDAPALKQADIGIAMGQGGTEVAREASDMLLTDDNFASIEAAVEEGRTVYRNLRKAMAFLLPVNGGESMTILISALLARDLPILALQVLWLNMINSITMTVPLAFEPKAPDTMIRPPRDPHEPLITPRLLRRILVVSAFNWVLIFGVFEWVRIGGGSLQLARTAAIQALVAARIIYLLSISQLGRSLAARLLGQAGSVARGPQLLLGIGLAVLLQVVFSQWRPMNSLFQTAPIGLTELGACGLAMVAMLPVAWLANRLDPSA